MTSATSPINGHVKKSILFLNHYLPADKGTLWVTPNEMRDRLVHCGVYHSLTVDMVTNALRRSNNGEKILWKNEFGKVVYYVPSIYPKSSEQPNAQRFKAKGGREQRIQINPERNYFKSCADAKHHLERVNNALDELAEVEEERQQPDSEAPEEETQRQDTETSEEEMQQPVSETSEPETNVDVDFEHNMDMQMEQNVQREREPLIQQRESADLWQGPEISPLNSNIFMDCNKMDDFIRHATCHSAQCGMQLKLIERDTKQGAAVKQVWICPVCNKKLCLLNTNMVKTAVVDRDRKFSRMQPEINLRLAGSFGVGINMRKTLSFVGGKLGIKTPNPKSMMNLNKKVRGAINNVFEERIIENRREHNEMTRNAEGYEGDLKWKDKNGRTHSTCQSNTSQDGAGCKRSYGNKHNGKQAAFVVNSSVTRKPLFLKTSQTSCVRCTVALNKRIKAHEKGTGKVVTIDQYSQFSSDHKGHCFRNSNINPASAEYHLAADAARDLLLDEAGEYRGDELAIFCRRISADNDTRAPKNAIQEQVNIIGKAAEDKGEHNPDQGHTVKNANNKFYKTRDQNPSMGGARCVSNVRIKSFHTDLRKAIVECTNEGNNAAAQAKCLKQMYATIPHHSGDHSQCFQEKCCTYLKVKNANPAWTEEEVETEAAMRSLRHRGEYMSIGMKARKILEDVVKSMFNEKSIGRIAAGGCSNASEALFGTIVMFSEGKRLNLDQTDGWKAMAELAVCITGQGNRDKTHRQLSALLGIELTAAEIASLEKQAKKNEQDRKRLNGESAKNQRTKTSLMRAKVMGKDSSKKESYRSAQA